MRQFGQESSYFALKSCEALYDQGYDEKADLLCSQVLAGFPLPEKVKKAMKEENVFDKQFFCVGIIPHRHILIMDIESSIENEERKSGGNDSSGFLSMQKFLRESYSSCNCLKCQSSDSASICELLGRLFEIGFGRKSPSIDTALEYYKMAADKGFCSGEYNYGRLLTILDVGKGQSQGPSWIISAASKGFVNAQCKLACMYLNGCDNFFAVNLEKAKFWMRLAAQNGHPVAQYNLAIMLCPDRVWKPQIQQEYRNSSLNYHSDEDPESHISKPSRKETEISPQKQIQSEKDSPQQESFFSQCSVESEGFSSTSEAISYPSSLEFSRFSKYSSGAARKKSLKHATANLNLQTLRLNADMPAWNWLEEAASKGLPEAQFAIAEQ